MCVVERFCFQNAPIIGEEVTHSGALIPFRDQKDIGSTKGNQDKFELCFIFVVEAQS